MGQGWPLADTYRWQVTDREQVFWAAALLGNQRCHDPAARSAGVVE